MAEKGTVLGDFRGKPQIQPLQGEERMGKSCRGRRSSRSGTGGSGIGAEEGGAPSRSQRTQPWTCQGGNS